MQWVEDNPLWEQKITQYKGDVRVVNIAKMRAMTVESLCLFLGVNVDTWREYSKREDFAAVCEWANSCIRQQKFGGAAADLLNPAIIARDLGLADKREITGANGAPLQMITSEMSAAQAAEAYAATLNN
jgi:hypothetical protein